MTDKLSDTPDAVKARQRRLRRGSDTEAQARAFTRRVSLQSMISTPLLEALADSGGHARPIDVYDRVADELSVDLSARAETRTSADGQRTNVFQQQVRWARQSLVAEGLIAGQRGRWELTDAAYAKLGRIRRGHAVLVYRTDDGIALWAHAEDAAAHIEEGSVKLLLTSPPYPVVKRAYGKFTVPEWLEWMHRLMGIWKGLLAEDGTIAVNLMDVFVGGTPMLSPYIERFTLAAIDDVGLNLAGKMFWHSPTKLGSINWSSKAKVQPKNSVEHLLLFSKNARPSWDITRMERGEYVGKERVRHGRSRRPSGYDIDDAAFARGPDGPLPGNLIVAPGAPGNDNYSRRCREAGLSAHPARYPEKLPRQVILMTTEKGDTVYDPMAGSNTTGMVASALGRRYISSDPMLPYVEGSAFRFDHRPDFRRFDVAS